MTKIIDQDTFEVMFDVFERIAERLHKALYAFTSLETHQVTIIIK